MSGAVERWSGGAGRLHALLFLALALSAGCRSRRDTCGDPVVVAQLFVDLMESGERSDALQLLSRAARERLDGMARDATARLGQSINAADLLVPERSTLARSEWLKLRSAEGDEAWVDVRPPGDAGAQGRGPWSTQRLVLEGGCWKVDLFYAPGLPTGIAGPTLLDVGPPDAGAP
jgi:hypothetical protein